MEAESSDAMPLGQLIGDGVAPCLLGEGRVKGRVENGHHRHVAAKDLTAGADDTEGGRVVERGKLLESFETGQNLVVDQRRPNEPFTAMDHAVPHRIDPRSARCGLHALDQSSHRLAMIPDPGFDTDLLDNVARELPPGPTASAELDRASLERRASRIEHE